MVAAIDAHVDAVRLDRADAPDLALLQRAQQLRLQLERQLADLVEEQRAAVGGLEQAGAAALAPVNAPRTWPNSSLSAMLIGRAAQLTCEQRSSARGDAACICSATSSLPTPVSPVMSTAESESATSAISRLAAARSPGWSRASRHRSIRRRRVQFARDPTAMVRPLLERLDQRGRAQRRARQRAKGRDEPLVEPVEPMRLQRIGRERAHHLSAVGQRAPEHACTVVERPGARLHNAVERVGQGCPPGSELDPAMPNHIEPRMFPAGVPARRAAAVSP